MELKGKGKLLTYWLLREESTQQEEDQVKDGLPAKGDFRNLPTENGERLSADWDTGGVNDAENNCIQMTDVKLFPRADSLVDNLRGYETMEENVQEREKQDHKSAGATAEEFHNKSEDGSVVTSANNTVQKEGSKEGQSEVNSNIRCADSYFVVSETEMEEECTNL